MRPPKSSAGESSTAATASTSSTANAATVNVPFENLVFNLTIPFEKPSDLFDDRSAKKCFLLVNDGEQETDVGDDSDSDERNFLLNHTSSCGSSVSISDSCCSNNNNNNKTPPTEQTKSFGLDNRSKFATYQRSSVASLYNYYSNKSGNNKSGDEQTQQSATKLIRRSETYGGNNNSTNSNGGNINKNLVNNFSKNLFGDHWPKREPSESIETVPDAARAKPRSPNSGRLKRVSSDITQKLSDISKLNYHNRHNRVGRNASAGKLSGDNTPSPTHAQIIVNQLEQFYAQAHDNTPPVIADSSLINVRANETTSLIFTKKFDNKLLPIVHKRIKKSKDRKYLEAKRKSLQLPVHPESSEEEETVTTVNGRLRHSWYGVEYNTVREEDLDDTLEDSIANFRNLAGAKSHHTNGTHESASLLDTHPQNKLRGICIQPGGQPHQTTTTAGHLSGDGSLGGPAPRKRRFEQFLKSLVGRRPSKEQPLVTNPPTPPPPLLLPSPELKVTKSPSVHSLSDFNKTAKLNSSTSSLNSVHQKLWSVVPLLKRDTSSCSNSQLHTTKSSNHLAPPKVPFLRKCETVLALSDSQGHQPDEPIRPLNRLRNCASVATCSRCSSLLSLAADGSKYSLNASTGGFVTVDQRNSQPTSGSSSDSLQKLTEATVEASHTPPPAVVQTNVRITTPTITVLPPTKFTCKLCLGEYSADSSTKIQQCGCSFCTECMTAYIEFEISEGAYEVSCPDAMCPAQGVISIAEITALAALSLVEKHHRYRLNREVELDKFRTWCPKAGCETICLVGPTTSEKAVTFVPSSSSALQTACAVHCPTCREDFCSGCKKPWHPTMSCEENTRRLAADGQNDDNLGIPFDSDLIKCCPMCAVPIEKDEGCAQMMCKRCKHVFCWYCLASLDDDFLLRHYDKGPCKNKLGHSRASVVWHRAQVIGIFAGFGILLLVASPLLLLAAPCIVCCKCRICSNATKLEDNDVDYDDAIALQR